MQISPAPTEDGSHQPVIMMIDLALSKPPPPITPNWMCRKTWETVAACDCLICLRHRRDFVKMVSAVPVTTLLLAAGRRSPWNSGGQSRVDVVAAAARMINSLISLNKHQLRLPGCSGSSGTRQQTVGAPSDRHLKIAAVRPLTAGEGGAGRRATAATDGSLPPSLPPSRSPNPPPSSDPVEEKQELRTDHFQELLRTHISIYIYQRTAYPADSSSCTTARKRDPCEKCGCA